MSTSKPLAGTSVLVTRPVGQAEQLCERLQAEGALAVHLPTLAIVPSRPSAALDALLAEVPAADWAVFASRNAVRYGLRLLAERGLRLDRRARLATVGAGTAKALNEQGYAVSCQPGQGFNTEALLAMPEFDVAAGERVLIFRGEGGRPLMGESLRARGAEVGYVEVYRREQPQVDVGAALGAWQQEPRRWVIATSSEGLSNLLQMSGAATGELQRAGLITVSERIAADARRQGWSGLVQVAAEPGDGGLLAAIVDAVQVQ